MCIYNYIIFCDLEYLILDTFSLKLYIFSFQKFLLGLSRLCQHDLEHNEHQKALSIANAGMIIM